MRKAPVGFTVFLRAARFHNQRRKPQRRLTACKFHQHPFRRHVRFGLDLQLAYDMQTSLQSHLFENGTLMDRQNYGKKTSLRQ